MEESKPPRVRRVRSQAWPARFFRQRIRPLFSRRLSALAAIVVPSLYMGYMRFVWYTSRIERNNFWQLHDIAAQHNGAVALLWHEEVMTVAYGYYFAGLRGHTLASPGDAGEVITRMLKKCNFVVFRGGSTESTSRRREGILDSMIAHMNSRNDVIYGLTVDGSKGPPYRMKTGGIIIARECNRPIVLVRTWYKRCVRLKTWDRMGIPLPFNVITYRLVGPIFVPESARTTEGIEAFRDQIEDQLIDLAARSYDDLGQPHPRNLIKRQEKKEP